MKLKSGKIITAVMQALLTQKPMFIMRDCEKLYDVMFNTKRYRVVFKDYRFRILTADNFGYTNDKFKISAVIDNE